MDPVQEQTRHATGPGDRRAGLMAVAVYTPVACMVVRTLRIVASPDERPV